MQDLAPLVPPRCLRALRMVVLHCSATASGQRIAPTPVQTAAAIDGWHKARGFRRTAGIRQSWAPQLPHIGYHYVLDVCGTVVPGRHVDEIGAHVQGHNTHSIGVCLVGGREPQARYTRAQWATLARLVPQLLTLGTKLAPVRVVGHRDLFPDANGDGRLDSRDWLKTCPGFDVAAWMQRGMQPLPEHAWPT